VTAAVRQAPNGPRARRNRWAAVSCAAVLCASAAPAAALPFVESEEAWPTAWNEAWEAPGTAFRSAVGSISTGFLSQRSDLRVSKDFDEARFRGFWSWQSDHTDRAQPDRLQSRSLYGTYAIDLAVAGPVRMGLALQHSYYKRYERTGPLFRFEKGDDRYIESTTTFASNVKWIELVDNDHDRNDPRRFHIVSFHAYPFLEELHARWRFGPAWAAEAWADVYDERFRLETIVPQLDNVEFEERWTKAKAVLAWTPSERFRLRATALHESFYWTPSRWWPVDWPIAPERSRAGPVRGDLRALFTAEGGSWDGELRVFGGFRLPDPIDLAPVFRNEGGASARFETPLTPEARYGVEAIAAAPFENGSLVSARAEETLRLHIEWRPKPETRLLGRAAFLATPTGSYHLFSMAVETFF